MDRTAVIHFSGICAHVRPPYLAQHTVVVADVCDRKKYRSLPLLADLPEHIARLVVRKENVVNTEVFTHASSLPVKGYADAWSWQLDGVEVLIETLAAQPPTTSDAQPGGVLGTPCGWDVPSLDAHAPLPTQQRRPIPDQESVQTRAAAIIPISTGNLVPVNFDPRSGGTGVQWELPVLEDGTVSVTFKGYRGQQHLQILLKVPPADVPGPIEPLILIENIGDTKDDERDFLFHYYALFGFVPENARPPRVLGVVEGGAGAGCSNSSYP